MKNYLLIFPLIIFFLIIFIFFYFLIIDRNPTSIPSALINKKVPIFETTSLIKKQKFVSKNEFGKEVTIVNFFATWCKPCRAEHKYIQKLSNKGIKIIGINYKDNSALSIKWLKELGNPYNNIAIDLDGQIAIDWGVYGIPETFIVNSSSIINYRHVGSITKKEYKMLLNILENNK